LFCDLEKEEVIENGDVESIYEIPQKLENEGLGKLVVRHLNLDCKELDLSEWNKVVERVKNLSRQVRIALVGKYVELKDAYLSVIEALNHGGLYNDAEVIIDMISSEEITDENAEKILKDYDGIIVPGGFGDRGIGGMISSIKYARENNVPYFGICLGMQLATIEFARNVLGLENANSTEIDKYTKYPIIDLMPDQKEIYKIGGTLRLGVYPCRLSEDTKARNIYNEEIIYERHRHRYEFNNEFKKPMED
ncbi:CTP synthase, partial [Vibrio parahaemolyticus]|nr:CTP synthase [Vibrio parahaemolyticus]